MAGLHGEGGGAHSVSVVEDDCLENYWETPNRPGYE
jgi:hypothetical protein